MRLNNRITLVEFINLIEENYFIVGDIKEKYVSEVNSISDASPESFVFIDKGRKDAKTLLNQTKAEIVICEELFMNEKVKRKCLIIVEEPKVVFAKVLDKLFPKNLPYSIHHSAIISAEAQIHEESHIGPFCYIGNAKIGKGTILHGNCYIYDNVTIGENVVISAGAVIGSEGIGHIKNSKNEIIYFPQLGGVTIGNNVEIGANSCIDRGTLSDTIIQDNVKINEHVYIAHNVFIKENSFVLGHAMICGSVVLGSNSYIAPSAVVRDGIKVGDYALIGLGSIVTKDVPEGETWAGIPGRPLDEFLEINKKLKKLK